MNIDDKMLPYVQCQCKKPWGFIYQFKAFLTFTSFFLSSWLPTVAPILHFNVPLSTVLIFQVLNEISFLQYSITWCVTWACHLVTILLSLRNRTSECAMLLCDVSVAGSPTAIEDPSPAGIIRKEGMQLFNKSKIRKRYLLSKIKTKITRK